MSMMVATQIKNVSRELGFTWGKALLITALGTALGVVLAIVIPLQVS
jgi:hypothetical protein